MKKFIYTIIFTLVAFVAFSSCCKEDLTPDEPFADFTGDFISINGNVMEVNSKTIVLCEYTEDLTYRTHRITLKLTKNFSSDVSVDKFGDKREVKTYDEYMEFTYGFPSKNIGKKTLMDFEGSRHLMDGKFLYTDAIWIENILTDEIGSREKSEYMATDESKWAGMKYSSNNFGRCETKVWEGDWPGYSRDTLTSGWYKIKNISGNRIQFSGELNTADGFYVKYSFSIPR